MSVFPLNYLSVIGSPVKVFVQRSFLRIWQMVFIVLVLVSFIMLPSAKWIGSLSSIDLQQYAPSALLTISEDEVSQFNSAKRVNTSLEFEAGGDFYLNEEQGRQALESAKDGFAFYPQGVLFKDNQSAIIKITYLTGQEGTIPQVEGKEGLITYLSDRWLEQGYLGHVMYLFVQVWFLNVFNFVGLLLGAAFLLWLTRFGQYFTIGTFRQAFHLCLNAIALPTLIGVGVAFLSNSPQVLTIVQSSLFVLYLLWVYWKTHFSDKYIASVLKK